MWLEFKILRFGVFFHLLFIFIGSLSKADFFFSSQQPSSRSIRRVPETAGETDGRGRGRSDSRSGTRRNFQGHDPSLAPPRPPSPRICRRQLSRVGILFDAHVRPPAYSLSLALRRMHPGRESICEGVVNNVADE